MEILSTTCSAGLTQIPKHMVIPLDIIKLILSYDKRFVIRHGEIIQINPLKSIMETYYTLTQIPRKQYWRMHEYEITFVFLQITEKKEYYISVINNKLEVSTAITSDSE